jgi:dihydropyrimidinase
VTDLLIRGGTVVTAAGGRSADVAVSGGTIAAVEPDLSNLAETAREVVDADGLLVLPGVVDVHTHTRLATDAEPDRFFQDSVAAAFGGTTTFLVFNTPRADESSGARTRSLRADLRRFRERTKDDSAVDYAPSLVVTGSHEDAIAELPYVVDDGVPTAKAFMVYHFRLDDRRLFDALRTMGGRGGMLQVHCEDPVLIDAAVAAALQRGDTLPRYHASTRPVWAEAAATERAMAFAHQSGAPVHVVHLSSGDALAAVRRAKAAGVDAHAETCPHYLALTAERYDVPDPVDCARYVISPPLREKTDQDALWEGLADGTLDLIATDHVPDRVGVEKAVAGQGVPFDRISNGAPGIETLLAIVWSEGVAKGRLSPERAVDLLSTTPARLFGLGRKGAIEVGRDADIVLFDPAARRTLTATDLHHTSDYTPYEGFPIVGKVRSVWVRGAPVIRDAAFVGQRGHGRFAERHIDA